jgi:hypothetical protein
VVVDTIRNIVEYKISYIKIIPLILFLLSINAFTEEAKNKYYKLKINCIVEYEKNNIFGAKLYFQGKKGFFLGFKGNGEGPEGKEYEWDQNRAETFYSSQFKGYSTPSIQGFNFGFSYQIIESLHLSVGLGFFSIEQYREYYDPDFTVWSKNYYIKDNMIDEWNSEILVGSYYRFRNFLVSLGYSTWSGNTIFGLGWSFDA